MKFFAVLALLMSNAPALHAQLLQGETQTARPVSEKPKPTELTAPARPKADSDLLRKQVTYSGFFVDVARGTNRFKLLSLRQPADAKRDHLNLTFDPATAKPIGFRLFSLDF